MIYELMHHLGFINKYSSPVSTKKYWEGDQRRIRAFFVEFAHKRGLNPLDPETWYPVTSHDLKSTKVPLTCPSLFLFLSLLFPLIYLFVVFFFFPSSLFSVLPSTLFFFRFFVPFFSLHFFLHFFPSFFSFRFLSFFRSFFSKIFERIEERV
jgi:hypothetical protein